MNKERNKFLVDLFKKDCSGIYGTEEKSSTEQERKKEQNKK